MLGSSFELVSFLTLIDPNNIQQCSSRRASVSVKPYTKESQTVRFWLFSYLSRPHAMRGTDLMLSIFMLKISIHSPLSNNIQYIIAYIAIRLYVSPLKFYAIC